jgi:hypothetical protein
VFGMEAKLFLHKSNMFRIVELSTIGNLSFIAKSISLIVFSMNTGSEYCIGGFIPNISHEESIFGLLLGKQTRGVLLLAAQIVW